MSRILFKLGGSLLDQTGLLERIRVFAALRAESIPVFLVGGGAAADMVREWDRTQGLGDDVAHDLALEAMGLNEQLLLKLMPELRLVRSLSQLEMAEKEKRPTLICAACFCRWGEQTTGQRLPRTWDLTSDSIAAWLAGLIEAEELVLLKSVEWIAGTTWDEAAERGWVDPCFPEFLPRDIKVSWGNGRVSPMQLVNCSADVV